MLKHADSLGVFHILCVVSFWLPTATFYIFGSQMVATEPAPAQRLQSRFPGQSNETKLQPRRWTVGYPQAIAFHDTLPQKSGIYQQLLHNPRKCVLRFSSSAKQAKATAVSTPAKQLNLTFPPAKQTRSRHRSRKAGQAVVPAPLLALLHRFCLLPFIVRDKPHQEIKKHLLLFLRQDLEQVNQFIFHAVPSSFKLSLIFGWG